MKQRNGMALFILVMAVVFTIGFSTVSNAEGLKPTTLTWVAGSVGGG